MMKNKILVLFYCRSVGATLQQGLGVFYIGQITFNYSQMYFNIYIYKFKKFNILKLKILMGSAMNKRSVRLNY